MHLEILGNFSNNHIYFWNNIIFSLSSSSLHIFNSIVWIRVVRWLLLWSYLFAPISMVAWCLWREQWNRNQKSNNWSFTCKEPKNKRAAHHRHAHFLLPSQMPIRFCLNMSNDLPSIVFDCTEQQKYIPKNRQNLLFMQTWNNEYP